MKKEYKIGETLIYSGVKLVVKSSESGYCYGCYLYEATGEFKNCKNMLCEPHNRKDENHVIFAKVESNETEKTPDGLNYLNMLIGILKQSITIPAYACQKIEILPLTKQLSVSILVDSEKSFILHAVKPTPQEVAIDLNEQYERFMSTEHEQVELK